MRKKVKNNKGFTLLELLVVVLIIGILAAVALPQYKKSVEKTKLTEALENLAVIEGAAQRYILAHPETSSTWLKDFLDVDLSGGEWHGVTYVTKNFQYAVVVNPSVTWFEIYRNSYDYVLATNPSKHSCITQETDMGRYICKYLETQGWEYIDAEIP